MKILHGRPVLERDEIENLFLEFIKLMQGFSNGDVGRVQFEFSLSEFMENLHQIPEVAELDECVGAVSFKFNEESFGSMTAEERKADIIKLMNDAINGTMRDSYCRIIEMHVRV